VALMFVVAAYATAEIVRPEAGLFATTIMGVALANQRWVPTRQLRAFGVPVVVLLLGSLFIVLAAGVDAGALGDHLAGGLVLAAVLVLVVRPLAVTAATVGAPSLPWRDRAFLACMAPRGIVAASTAALFSLRLEDIGQPSSVLTPVAFAVIIALAVVYGLGARPAARRLGVARPPAHGAVVLSGEPWAQQLATELSAAGLPTLLVARGRADLQDRPDLPFAVYTGLVHALPRSGLLADMGRAVVASRDDETDLLALTVLSEVLGRRNVWVLPSRAGSAAAPDGEPAEAWARRPFGPGVTHRALEELIERGGCVRTVPADAVPDGALPLVRLHGDDWTAAPDGPAADGDGMIVAAPPAGRTVPHG
jgi:hypothetical protein